jgi:hypothetical protein
MVFAHQIRKVVAEYLSPSRNVDIDGFVRNFAPLSHDILKNGEPEAIRLANVIEASLASLYARCSAEAQFRSNLRSAVSMDVPNIVFVATFPVNVNRQWGASGSRVEWQPADREREMESWSVEYRQA